LLLTLAHFFPSIIEHHDQLIDDLQQSARVGLNGGPCAKLSPVFFVFVGSHITTKARIWPESSIASVDEAAIETADAQRVAAWALVTRGEDSTKIFHESRESHGMGLGRET
jgi:hypothetical protein